MAQNVYDDDRFLAAYSDYPRSRDGLAATSEWPAFQSLLPPVAGQRTIDLGCGFGQISRWLADAGARSVLGIDLSEKMLTRAVAETTSPAVRYWRADLETLVLEPHSADLVVSSMALHYLEDFGRVSATVHAALVPGGHFVFSVEHPIYAARAEPEWLTANGGRRAFALIDYGLEGRRVTNWIVDGVVKYHRSIATMLNTLVDAGFDYRRLVEWTPSEEQLCVHPEWRETEFTRPMFMLVSVTKPQSIAA